MTWLRTNWAIVTFVLTMAAAWGQQELKVQNLEQAIVQQTTINRELKETREQVIRQDERLKSIDKSQQVQEQLLRDLLQGQREISRKVK